MRDEVIAAGEGFVEGLDNKVTAVPCVAWSLMSIPGGLQRVAEVPIYSADTLARRAAGLQKTNDALPPSARICAATLQALSLNDGVSVRVRQGSGEVVLTAKADPMVPAGCVRVAAAHVSTAVLGEMFGAINVERA